MIWRIHPGYISFGYKQKHSRVGKLMLLLVYMYDMIIISNDEIEKQALHEKIITWFEMRILWKN